MLVLGSGGVGVAVVLILVLVVIVLAIPPLQMPPVALKFQSGQLVPRNPRLRPSLEPKSFFVVSAWAPLSANV